MVPVTAPRIHARGCDFQMDVLQHVLRSNRLWMRRAVDPPPPPDQVLHYGLGFEQVACVEIKRVASAPRLDIQTRVVAGVLGAVR